MSKRILTNRDTHQELEIEYRVVESASVAIHEAEQREERPRESHAAAVNGSGTSEAVSAAQPVGRVSVPRTLVARTVCQDVQLNSPL